MNRRTNGFDILFIFIIATLIFMNIFVYFKANRFLEFDIIIDKNEKSQLYADMYNIQLEEFCKPKSFFEFNIAHYPQTPYREKHSENPPNYYHFMKLKFGDSEVVVALDGSFIWPDH